LKKVTTVFFNFYRNEDEQQFGVEQEEAEKGKRIYHKELLLQFLFLLNIIIVAIVILL